jgi:hypothetical protein
VGELRDNFSRDPIELHASVAALLGPSAGGREALRLVLEDFSPSFPDRRVVRIVCVSGLGERRKFSSSLSVGFSSNDVFGILLDELFPPRPAWLVLGGDGSEDIRGVGDGLGGSEGRDNSE